MILPDERSYDAPVGTQTLVTFDDFLALPEEEARRYEYVDGGNSRK